MVAARRPGYLARITELNLIPVPFYKLDEYLYDIEIIFNTVPVLVLTEEILRKVSPEAVIIDLASAPGAQISGQQRFWDQSSFGAGLPAGRTKDSRYDFGTGYFRLLLEEMGR